MQQQLQCEYPTSIDLAAALLRAWMCGDLSRVRAELTRSLDCGACEDAAETERRLLLHAVSSRLQTCPDIFAPQRQDPALDLCINLLVHLAQRESAEIEDSYCPSESYESHGNRSTYTVRQPIRLVTRTRGR